MQSHSKRVALLGILISIGLILGYIESLFILPIKIPGIKFGFSNIITIISFYMYGPIAAILVLVSRVLLSGLLFGNGISIIYSLSGAIFSYLAMLCIYKNSKVSIVGVSIVGGVTHNIGQLLIAMLAVENINILVYLPALIIAGVIAGLFVGIISREVLKRLKGV